MSTKIYDGYIIKRPVSEFGAVLAEVKAALETAQRELTLALTGQLAAAIVDFKRTGSRARVLPFKWEELELGVAASAHNILVQATKEVRNTRQRNPAYDMEFEVVFLFSEDIDAFYAIIYTEQEAYKEAFRSVLGVEEYMYYNSSEEPEGVSRSDWEARGKVWDKLIPMGAPGRHGVVWNLVGEIVELHLSRRSISLAEVLARLPTSEVRAKWLATEKAQARASDETDKRLKAEGSSLKEAGLSVYFDVIDKAANYLDEELAKVGEMEAIELSDLGKLFWE